MQRALLLAEVTVDGYNKVISGVLRGVHKLGKLLFQLAFWIFAVVGDNNVKNKVCVGVAGDKAEVVYPEPWVKLRRIFLNSLAACLLYTSPSPRD